MTSQFPSQQSTPVRLWVNLIMLVGVVLLLIGGFFFWYYPARMTEWSTAALFDKARIVSSMAAAGAGSAIVFPDSALIIGSLHAVAQADFVRYAVVIDNNGTICSATGFPAAQEARFLETPPGIHMDPEGQALRSATAITHGGLRAGTLYMGFSDASIRNTGHEARTDTLIAVLSAFVFGLATVAAISLLMTRRHTAFSGITPGPLDGVRKDLDAAKRDLETHDLARTAALKQEIADRHRTEESLRQSEQRLRQVIDLVPQFIFAKDLNGRFILVNTAVAEAYGTTVGELLGKTDADYAASEEEVAHFRRDDLAVINAGIPRVIPEETITTAAGEVRTLQTIKIPFTFSGSTMPAVLGVSTNITDLKRVERELKSSLAEKEVLLKEIHHRVKNNLQVISSLLSLQTPTLTDPATIEIFRESQDRIRSMALVHERLYQSGNLADVDFREYLDGVTSQLVRSYKKPGVECTINAEPIHLSIDQAIPCGLIVHELLSNALKHAFTGREKGHIEVGFRRAGAGRVGMSVSDDGVGFPAGADFRNMRSMGMLLVVSLAHQIEGTITLTSKSGCTFFIEFPA